LFVKAQNEYNALLKSKPKGGEAKRGTKKTK
jgi:hypothetical protein